MHVNLREFNYIFIEATNAFWLKKSNRLVLLLNALLI